MRLFFLLISLILSFEVHADCTYKIINDDKNIKFDENHLRMTIGNLYLFSCLTNPRMGEDELTRVACEAHPEMTFFSHPKYPETCSATNHWPVYIIFKDTSTNCYSEPQITVDRDVVLHYPADFKCEQGRR